MTGSPPHTRDKSKVFKTSSAKSRITPAYAGQIWKNLSGGIYNRDHPRIRGTNIGGYYRYGKHGGSPPHTRDKSVAETRAIAARGITPAYAGQIPCWVVSGLLQGDHPRIRGTNSNSPAVFKVFSGSPPHTRDKLAVRREMPAWTRITPAYAGQMQAIYFHSTIRRDHPRIRGTNC